MNATAWIHEHQGPLEVTLNSTTLSTRLTDSTGDRLEATGAQASLCLFEALAAAGRIPWAADGLAQARRHRAFLNDLGTPTIRCAKTLRRAIEPGRDVNAPKVGTVASEVSRLINGISQTVRRAALDVVADELVFRPRALIGWAVDENRLRTIRGELRMEMRALTPGLDVNQATPAQAGAWLRTIGVKPEFDEYHYLELDQCVVPPEASDAWARFREAWRLRIHDRRLAGIIRRVVDGRVAPVEFDLNSALTGRMAIRDPGLVSLKKRLRPVLVPDPGEVLLSVDHSSAELKVIARLSGEPGLVASDDAYADLAVAVGVDRGTSKKILLPWVYGQGLAGAIEKFGPVAEPVRNTITELWPTLSAWLDGVKRSAARGEQLTTLWGRPLPKPERVGKAANLIVQGTARDAFGLACRRAANMGLNVYLPVHDELIVSAPIAQQQAAAEALLAAMTVDLGDGIVLTGEVRTMTAWA